jgi:hypothetical protein
MFETSIARAVSLGSAFRERREEGDATVNVDNPDDNANNNNNNAGSSAGNNAAISAITMPPPADLADPHIVVRGKLDQFRILTGIHTADTLAVMTILRRPAPNLGIYARTVHAEGRMKLEYEVFSVLINGCLGLQIIVAAALTALGASNGSHKAVTAFGAINTVIAGFLTFLKGSGLPNRLRYYQNEWSKVREYIEQRERDFALSDCKLDVETEVRIVEQMYDEVKQDVENNSPDSFVSRSQAKQSPSILRPSEAGDPPAPTSTRRLSEMPSIPSREGGEETSVQGSPGVAENQRSKEWRGRLSSV